MTKCTTLLIVVVAAFTGWLANDAFTDDSKKPTDEEMMAEMMTLGAPGEAHEVLARMVGDAKTTMYTSNGEMEGDATCKQTSIFDGRFVKTDYAGDFMGTPFQGIGLMGYDNFKKKYISVWTDSFSTNVAVSEGTCSDDHKVLTFHYDQPTKWGDIHMRSVYTLTSDTEFTLEMFTKMDGAETERKEVQIVFTKKGAAADCEK